MHVQVNPVDEYHTFHVRRCLHAVEFIERDSAAGDIGEDNGQAVFAGKDSVIDGIFITCQLFSSSLRHKLQVFRCSGTQGSFRHIHQT